jgi:hypothetical protein
LEFRTFSRINKLTPADVVIKIQSTVSKSTSQTRNTLQKQGVTYQDGKLSVKTDRAAPSREEYIAQTQRAFEAGAKKMQLHPEAFKVGPSREATSEPLTASSVETP